MDPAFEKKYHEFEDQYWWFRARRDCVARLIQSFILTDACILEIGCSGGPLLELLRNKGYENLTGIDVSPSAIELCKSRGFSDVQVMDATTPTFGNRQFDLIIASDVLEHIEHADRALANWTSLLRPGGKLIVFVPAFMFLWSPHDTVNHHFRRYTAASLKSDLQSAGFVVHKTSYWNTMLFPPVAAVRLARRLVSRQNAPATDQLNAMNPLLNALLENLVSLENRAIAAGLRLPVGVSVMAIAEKP